MKTMAFPRVFIASFSGLVLPVFGQNLGLSRSFDAAPPAASEVKPVPPAKDAPAPGEGGATPAIPPKASEVKPVPPAKDAPAPGEGGAAPAIPPTESEVMPVPSGRDAAEPIVPDATGLVPSAPGDPSMPAPDPNQSSEFVAPPAETEEPATPPVTTSDRASSAGDLASYPGTSSIAPGTFGPRPGDFVQNTESFFSAGGLGGTLLDGFGMSASLAATYDSNPYMGIQAPGQAGESGFFMTLGGAAKYRSTSPEWAFAANYSGSYNEYFEQSELSGYKQNSGASVNYDGEVFSASLSTGLAFDSGANRNYGTIMDQVTFNYDLRARYELSLMTSLSAYVSQILTDLSNTSGGNYSNTDTFTLGTAALWQYSDLTELGAGLRYRTTSGNSDQVLTSIGPTLSVRYKASDLVSLSSWVGMDFSQYENGQSADPTVSGSLAVVYRPSLLWGMTLSMTRNTQADASLPNAFTEATAINLDYYHKLLSATLNLGLSYQTDSWDSPGGAARRLPDRDYLRFNGALSMPVFTETSFASVFASYSDQSGGTTKAWDSWQTGVSFTYAF